MKRWVLFGVLMWTASASAQTTVNGRNPQLPDTLGPNGGLKVECIAGTCTGSGGGTAATVAIDQTTPGTTNGVFVNNFPTLFGASQSGAWNVGISGSVDISDRSGRLLGTIANTSFNVGNFPATQAVTQSGTFTVSRNWTLSNLTDNVNVGNFPATQTVAGTVAATQSGTWTVGVNNFPATQPVSGTVAVSNFPATQPVSGTVTATDVPPTITKGTQGTTGFTTQNLKDAGRTLVSCSAVAATLVTTEALLTMTCNKAGVNQTAATTYTVTAGKTLRITSIYQSTLNLTTAALLAVDIFIRSAATCSAASPIVGYVGSRTPPATAVLQSGATGAQQFPDGLEIAAAQQICVSQLSRNTTNGNVTMMLTGFEY